MLQRPATRCQALELGERGLTFQTRPAEIPVVVRGYPSPAQERETRSAMSRGAADEQTRPLAEKTGARRALQLRTWRRRPM